VAPQFWYGFESVFSGQTLYDPYIYQLFNIFFASLPIVIYAVLDHEYSDEMLLKNPKFYLIGRENIYFTNFKYWTWFIVAFIQALLVYVIAFYTLHWEALGKNGLLPGYWCDGNIVLQVIVFIVNLKILVFSAQYSVL